LVGDAVALFFYYLAKHFVVLIGIFVIIFQFFVLGFLAALKGPKLLLHVCQLVVLLIDLLQTLLLLVEKHVTFICVANVDPILLVHKAFELAVYPYQLLLDYLIFELAVTQSLLKLRIMVFAHFLDLFRDLLQPLTVFV